MNAEKTSKADFFIHEESFIYKKDDELYIPYVMNIIYSIFFHAHDQLYWDSKDLYFNLREEYKELKKDDINNLYSELQRYYYCCEKLFDNVGKFLAYCIRKYKEKHIFILNRKCIQLDSKLTTSKSNFLNDLYNLVDTTNLGDKEQEYQAIIRSFANVGGLLNKFPFFIYKNKVNNGDWQTEKDVIDYHKDILGMDEENLNVDYTTYWWEKKSFQNDNKSKTNLEKLRIIENIEKLVINERTTTHTNKNKEKIGNKKEFTERIEVAYTTVLAWFDSRNKFKKYCDDCFNSSMEDYERFCKNNWTKVCDFEYFCRNLLRLYPIEQNETYNKYNPPLVIDIQINVLEKIEKVYGIERKELESVDKRDKPTIQWLNIYRFEQDAQQNTIMSPILNNENITIEYPLSHEYFGYNNIDINKCRLLQWVEYTGISYIMLYKIHDIKNNLTRFAKYIEKVPNFSKKPTFYMIRVKADNFNNFYIYLFGYINYNKDSNEIIFNCTTQGFEGGYSIELNENKVVYKGSNVFQYNRPNYMHIPITYITYTLDPNECYVFIKKITEEEYILPWK